MYNQAPDDMFVQPTSWQTIYTYLRTRPKSVIPTKKEKDFPVTRQFTTTHYCADDIVVIITWRATVDYIPKTFSTWHELVTLRDRGCYIPTTFACTKETPTSTYQRLEFETSSPLLLEENVFQELAMMVYQSRCFDVYYEERQQNKEK